MQYLCDKNPYPSVISQQSVVDFQTITSARRTGFLGKSSKNFAKMNLANFTNSYKKK